MADTLSVSKQECPSAASLVVSAGAVSFVVILVLGALVHKVLRGTNTIGTVTTLALVSAVLIGPLFYLIIIRPLIHRLSRRPAPAAAMEYDAGTGTIDPVTHALNRRGITTSLIEAMAQSQRYATPLCAALVSIDGFGQLAERHGQKFADQTVQWAVGTITDALRLPDRVGRHEGGEFLVVMPQTRAPAATKVAERLREAVAASPLATERATEPLTISVGVVEFAKGHDLEKLLSQAQAALAEARAAGGNRVIRIKVPRRRKGSTPEAG
ncbi:MAG: GGDEF domain-containing protein [Acidiferrobacteraceae bacterium]